MVMASFIQWIMTSKPLVLSSTYSKAGVVDSMPFSYGIYPASKVGFFNTEKLLLIEQCPGPLS